MRFKQLRKQTKKCIAISYHRYLQSLSEKLKVDPNKFCCFHAIKSKTKRLPAVVTYKYGSASESVDKATLLNEFFSTVYSSDNVNHEHLQVDVLHPDLLSETSTTQNEVENILLNLDAKKATGVDGISAKILKSCARQLSMPLSKLLNLSFSLGEVPSTWKRANVTPVFEDNAKENVENYRSISLLSILGKCQERIFHRAIYSHVSPFLTDWQHDFVKGRSCITQLVVTHHMWGKALDAGLQVDAVFLHFATAFDRVNHKILLHKLCNFGISGSLLAWCGDYLSNRKQRVVVDGKCSSWLNIPSGVPQGSTLGPLFFIIFISDLPEVVSQERSVALYADDCKMFRVVNCPSDLTMFQDDLDSLCTWTVDAHYPEETTIQI